MRFFQGRLFSIVTLLVLFSASCFVHGGVSTVKTQNRTSGSGFLSVAEHNGQWEAGEPPKEGDATEIPLYKNLKKTFSISLLGASNDAYALSDAYPRKRYRIIAIREVGTSTEGGKTVHYYEVEFARETTP